jgi:putative peptide zinc metalloprotease protein
VTPTAPEEVRRPCLRRDLEFTHRQAGGEAEVIVCDPLTGRYFRAGELEAGLFALLDGERSVEEVAERLTAEFPDLPAEEVPVFVDHLDRLGFLEGSAAIGVRPRPPLFRRLLFAQVRLGNPDRLFARLLPYVGWLYRPAGWAFVAALLLVAATVATLSHEELMMEAAESHGPAFWLRFWIGLSLIGTIHEFGHGLTCKYFGGRSTGIGLLWMYGLPCFYCDVSGAWTLPRKSERIWVGLGGLYYQFVAGAVALLIWRVLEPGTLLSSLLLAMATSCGVLSLINLNPLLKLDGYYLLSDWLEIPNLRTRSFEALGKRLERFWFGGAPAGSAAEEAPPREQRVYLTYGVVTALFLGWLISRLLSAAGQFLTGRLGGAGALLFVVIVGMAFGPPVGRALVVLGRRLAQWKEIPMKGRRRLLIAGGVLLLVPLALVVVPWQLRLTSPCKLEAAARASVRARAAGQVAELTTREGARVRRGEVVGHLGTFEREKQRAEREAQLRMVQLEIGALEDRLPIIAADTERGAAEAATGAQAARTQLTEERLTLPGRVAESRSRTEAAHADLETARARLEEARAAVDAQSRIATRQRTDADRAERGEEPPSLAAAHEEWQRRVAEQDQAQRDHERIKLLLADGAVAPQQLDSARTRDAAAGRRAEQARQALEAERKRLRETAEDAEAELARRRRAFDAARQEVTAARANELAAQAAARLVVASTSPAHLETARLRAASGDAAQVAARTARRELLARRAEIHVKRQEAERLAAQIAILSDQLRRSDLTAPCDGVVTTPRVEERIGAHFDAGDAVLDVEDPSSLFTRIFVNEKELADIRSGQPVSLRVAAFPDRLYRGRVSEIAPRAVPGGTPAFPTNTVEVRLRVENPTGELRPGTSGWAKIDCGTRPLGAILLRRVSRYLRTEVWTWF